MSRPYGSIGLRTELTIQRSPNLAAGVLKIQCVSNRRYLTVPYSNTWEPSAEGFVDKSKTQVIDTSNSDVTKPLFWLRLRTDILTHSLVININVGILAEHFITQVPLYSLQTILTKHTLSIG